MSGEPLQHPLLLDWGVSHGFGLRDSPEPRGVVRVQQVHGNAVAHLNSDGRPDREEADALLSDQPGVPVAIVTADCVPILAAAEGGGVVVAIHAGWKGLAGGAIPAGIRALRERAPGRSLRAVVGPHVGIGAYEVDEPVLRALKATYGVSLDLASRSTRPGHARIDLGFLANRALQAAGIAKAAIGALPGTCTASDPQRFHSYRRDGALAGRLLHYIVAREEVEA